LLSFFICGTEVIAFSCVAAVVQAQLIREQQRLRELEEERLRKEEEERVRKEEEAERLKEEKVITAATTTPVERPLFRDNLGNWYQKGKSVWI